MGPRHTKHSPDDVWAERKKFQRMPVEEKRLYYPCGPHFVRANDLQPWPDREINARVRQTYRYPENADINQKISLWRGDITELEIDGIVNSACDPHTGTGQVNKVLYDRAGTYYQDECALKGLPEVGQTKVTGGYVLPTKYIIHTIPPRRSAPNVLANCYENCLEAAVGHGIKTLAVPCLGTNKFLGFSANKAAHIALAAVRHWMERNANSMDRVVFCVYSEEDEATYQELLQIYFPVTSRVSTATTSTSSTLEESTESDPTDEQIAVRQREFMLVHQMVRMVTGCRPSMISTSDSSDAETSQHQTIEQWQADKALPSFQPLRVDRSGDVPLVKTLLVLYNHMELDFYRRPLVQFTGEEGLDLGALAREFFFQSLQALTQGPVGASPAFEGAPGHRLPCASRVHSRTGVYEAVGKLLGHSTLHDGVGLVGLSPAIVFLLTHAVDKEDVDVSGVPLSVDDVADPDLQMLLKKSETLEELDSNEQTMVKGELRSAMERCNYGYSPINSTTLGAIIQELTLYEVIYKRWDQITSLRHGLEAVGLYSFLCENPSEANIRRVFPTPEDAEILPEMIQLKIVPKTSINTHQEYFRTLLQDIHDGKLEDATLPDLLAFWTGHPIPPEGDLHVIVNESGRYPTANCCFFKLELPGLSSSYEEFKEAFHVALTSGAASGFTRA